MPMKKMTFGSCSGYARCFMAIPHRTPEDIERGTETIARLVRLARDTANDGGHMQAAARELCDAIDLDWMNADD